MGPMSSPLYHVTGLLSAGQRGRTALAKLTDYETSESWAEFDDFVSNSRVYSDFSLTRLTLVPQPKTLFLAASALLSRWKRTRCHEFF